MTGTEQIAALVIAGNLRPSDYELREIGAHVDGLRAAAEKAQAIADAANSKHAEALATLAQVQRIWDASPRYIQHEGDGPPTTHPPGALFVGPPSASDLQATGPAYLRDRSQEELVTPTQ